MTSFSLVPGASPLEDRKAKRPGRPSRATGGLRTMSLAAGVLLALASVSHGQSQISTLSRGEPSAQRTAVEQQLIPDADARQSTTVLAARRGTGQSRDKDYLYDEIMRRVGVPLEDIR